MIENKKCEVCGNEKFEQLFVKDSFTYQKCLKCNLIRIYPQPTDKDLDDIYNGDYFKRWGDKKSDEESIVEMKRATFLKILKVIAKSQDAANCRLLDIGAATGILMQVAHDLGYEVYGIEASKDGADEIRNKFGDDKIFNGYFDESFNKWQKGYFDVIALIDSFEHLRNPNAILDIAKGLLKEGGCLIMSTPNSGSLTHFISGKNWNHFSTEHLFIYSKKNLSALLSKHNFRVIGIKSLSKYFNAKYLSAMFAIKNTFLDKAFSLFFRLLSKVFKFNLPLKTGQMIAVAVKESADNV
jgi:2-polyprenyl-3-methyl-5-hydroxy-6-metoxy-1,4-benzoquinol methylase